MGKFVKTESHSGEHGHWIQTWKDDYDPFDDLYMCRINCDKCGHSGSLQFNFCPWCGAVMDGKVEVRHERTHKKEDGE